MSGLDCAFALDDRLLKNAETIQARGAFRAESPRRTRDGDDGAGPLRVRRRGDSRFQRCRGAEAARIASGRLRFPVQTIAQRWFGVYAKHPSQPWFSCEPEPGVRVVTGVGGAGMTLSFGLADRMADE